MARVRLGRHKKKKVSIYWYQVPSFYVTRNSNIEKIKYPAKSRHTWRSFVKYLSVT